MAEERMIKQAYGVTGEDTGIIIYSKDGSARSPEEFDRAAFAYRENGQTPPGFIAVQAAKDKFGKMQPSGFTANMRDLATSIASTEVPQMLQGQQKPDIGRFGLEQLGGLLKGAAQLPLEAINNPLPIAGAAAGSLAMPQVFAPAWLARTLGASVGAGVGKVGQGMLSEERVRPGDVAMDMLLTGGLGTAGEVLTGFASRYLRQTAKDSLQKDLRDKFISSVPGLQDNPQLLNAQASSARQWKEMVGLGGKQLAADASERAQLAGKYIQADSVLGVEAAENMPLKQVALHPKLQKDFDHAIQKVVDRTQQYIDNIINGKEVPETLVGYLDTPVGKSPTAREMLSNVMDLHLGLNNPLASKQINSSIERALNNYATTMKQSVEGAYYLKILRDAGAEKGFNPLALRKELERYVGSENSQAADALKMLGLSPLTQTQRPMLGNIGYQITDKMPAFISEQLYPPFLQRAVNKVSSGLAGPDMLPWWMRGGMAGATQTDIAQRGSEQAIQNINAGIKSFLGGNKQEQGPYGRTVISTAR